MTAIVFGSPAAAAVLKCDGIIAQLEDKALENAAGGFWVCGLHMHAAQVREARRLVAAGLWESDDDDDMPVCDYRPNEAERKRIAAKLGGGS